MDDVAVLGRCDKPTLKFLKQYFHYVSYTGFNGIEASYDQILCDGFSTGMSAVEYLINLGHKHIRYIGETNSEIRYFEYLKALNDHKLPVKDSYVASVPLSSDGGYKGTKELVERHTDITAVFCGNDITAIGAIRAIKDEGYTLPMKIALPYYLANRESCARR